MKIMKLGLILGVNYRTASYEVHDIEKQLMQKAGKLFNVAEQLIDSNIISSKEDIP